MSEIRIYRKECWVERIIICWILNQLPSSAPKVYCWLTTF